MKKIFYLIALTLIIGNAFGQFRVITNSYVDIKNGRLTIKTNNPTVDIGCDEGTGNYNSTLYFWHSNSLWNNLKAASFIVMSDSNIKTNITPIENASDVLGLINTYSYSMADNPEVVSFGVLAQELETILPELVDSTHGEKGVNYIGLIPFLIKGFQEKSKELDDLKEEMEFLKADNQFLKEQIETLFARLDMEMPTPATRSAHNTISNDKSILYQNNPNPFTQSTQIRYYLSESCSKAILKIYDLNKRGEQYCTIHGSELEAGMYIYALIVDNQIVDTKRMVLTK